MAPRITRSKAKAPIVKTMVKDEVEALARVSSVAQKNPLQPSSQNPPKLFVLPKNTTADAKIVTLSHPRYAAPTRYFVCPKKGFYEFKKISAPKSTPRSWLLAPTDTPSLREIGLKQEEKKDNEYNVSRGYVTSDASLYIATPIDPLFLVLPALAAQCTEEKQRFLEADEYFDTLIATAPHYRPLLQNQLIKMMLELRMAAVCDTVDAGDETMYRLNLDKLLQILTQKCRAMVAKGLPASLEEVRVRKALEKPLASKLRDLVADEEALSTPKTDTESQPSLPTEDSFSTPVSEASTAVTPDKEPEVIDAPEEIVDALRIQTAYMFLVTSYIPSPLATILSTKMSVSSDSNPLSKHISALANHLKELKDLREKAALSRSLGDFSHKREYNEEGEARAEKKRKLEEEEKLKKKNMSQGVKKLMKVNTNGMKKMSDFFKKKA